MTQDNAATNSSGVGNPRGEPVQAPRKNWYNTRALAVVPIVAAAVITIMLVLSGTIANELPLYLVPILNTLLIFVADAWVAGYLLTSYKRTGSWFIYLLGEGILLFGISWALSGWFALKSINDNSAVHLPIALTASLFILIGCILAGRNTPEIPESHRAKNIFIALASISAFAGLVVLLTVTGVMPAFYVGTVRTALRQALLGITIGVFGITTILMLAGYRRSRSVVMLWIGAGLFSVAVSYIFGAFVTTLGSWVPWAVRLVEYSAVADFFIAAMAIRDEARTYRRSAAELVADFARQARINYEQLINAASDAIVAVDGLGRILIWNPAAEKMFLYTRKEATGLPVITILGDPEDAAVYQKASGAGGAQRISTTIELKGRRKGGEGFPMEMTLAGKQVANGWLPGAASATTLIIRDITRRKKTEAALLESEAKANALIKYAPTGIYEIDFRGPRIVSANDAMSLLSGYSHEELLTMDPNMLLEPESRKLFAERAKRTLAGEALSDSVEYQVRKKDGTVIDVIVNASFPKDKPYMAFVVGYDITQRKKIEQALRETSAYLDNLFNYANAPIIVWNPGFEITRFNHAFEHLTGLMTDEAIGKKLEILFPEQTRGQSMDLIRRTAAGEKWESVEIPILRRDGTVRTVLWNSATIYSEAGKTPLATIAQGQDITGRKKAEDELKESEARFRSVLDNSQDVIVRFNLQTGSYEYVSPSVADLTGYSPEEYMAMDKKSALDMIHPEDFSQFTSAMEASVQTGKAAIEYRQKTKNGAYIWVSNHMAVIRDAEGRPLFRDSNIHDVTARRQAEQALRETNKELKRFNDVAVGRELRMIELKKEINRLSLMCGDEPPYPSVSNEDAP